MPLPPTRRQQEKAERGCPYLASRRSLQPINFTPTREPRNKHRLGCPMSEEENKALDLARLDLERQKHREEIALKERELDLQFKQAQQSALRSPLFLAVIAGIVGLLSNALVALINGSSQRALEKERSEATQTLAQQQAEADRILEALKTGDPDKAAANLELLVRTNLVSDEADTIREYLDQRIPGEGASLPAPSITSSPLIYGGVVGNDDRKTVRDVYREPFNAICLVSIAKNAQSTGFLIHPRIVLVATYAMERAELSTTVVKCPANSSGSDTGGWTPVMLIAGEAGEDLLNYSFLIMPKSPPRQVSVFDLPGPGFSRHVIEESKLHFAGYAGDRPGLSYNSGTAVSVTDIHIFHTLDTGAGAGGGPIWIERDGKHVAVAIHLSTGNERGKLSLRLDTNEIRKVIDSLNK